MLKQESLKQLFPKIEKKSTYVPIVLLFTFCLKMSLIQRGLEKKKFVYVFSNSQGMAKRPAKIIRITAPYFCLHHTQNDSRHQTTSCQPLPPPPTFSQSATLPPLRFRRLAPIAARPVSVEPFDRPASATWPNFTPKTVSLACNSPLEIGVKKNCSSNPLTCPFLPSWPRAPTTPRFHTNTSSSSTLATLNSPCSSFVFSQYYHMSYVSLCSPSLCT